MKSLKITQQITKRESDAFMKYLQEISKLNKGNNLTVDEEVELAERIKNGDKRAEKELIERNLKFVISVAKQYQNEFLQLEDLVSEGNYGLIKAARKFDSSRGCKFISYAVWWIRQSILCFLNEHSRSVRLPLNKITQLNKIKKAQEKFEQENQRKPTSEEVLDILEFDLSIEDLNNIFLIDRGCQSLSADVSSNPKTEGYTLEDTIADTDGLKTDYKLDREDSKIVVRQLMSALPDKHKLVIELYYGLTGQEPKTLEEISVELGLTRERIRQVKKDAIRHLSSTKNRRIVQPYCK